MTTAPARVATGARVDDAGVLVRTPVEGPLVVSLDGRYVWAFTAARDGRAHRGGVLVPWPEVLRPFLSGWSRVRVAGADGRQVLLDEEVRLGDGDGRVAVVDAQGLPLAVDKVGHLGRAFSATDAGVRDEILAGTQRALTDLSEACGLTAYLSYGALLGAVRDGAMIAHDSDTDVCYLSHETSPADLILESYRVERALRDLGWNLLRMSGGDLKLLLPLSDGRVCHIDVFVAFRVAGTFYQLGNRSGRLPESAILPLSTVELHGFELPAPARPEEMLAFVYGPSWRVPDPSFQYADPVAGVRRLDGWLRGFRTDMGRWTAFHHGEARGVPRRRSSFARWVHRQLPAGDTVADVGAGTGRDALWFGTRGRPVLAYDFSRAARSRLARRARRRKLPVEARLLVLNELRSVLVTGAELARAEPHLYARHVLGSLDDAARANLWLLSRMALRRGGLLFLEFSATTGRSLPEPEPAGLVRRLAPDVVRREVEAAGGLVELEELGPGEDLFDRPDPAVCRMRVAWPGPRDHRSTPERTTS
ncbi:class I SAM-dependent methyltransferase [Nocardioides sp. 503]|uniref:class I SAM-dependent methyltransferase n=1 Tax=Nocardioides sp. 503 TaxID=2508326 RepID=UPI00106F9E59|nr:class I SAM-dependent methyltransferase [Nocardioides sp. 503]